MARIGKGVAIWHSHILVVGGQFGIIPGKSGDLLSKVLRRSKPFHLGVLPVETIWHMPKLDTRLLIEDIKNKDLVSSINIFGHGKMW